MSKHLGLSQQRGEEVAASSFQARRFATTGLLGREVKAQALGMVTAQW